MWQLARPISALSNAAISDTIPVSNNGPSAAINASLTDVLSDGMTFASLAALAQLHGVLATPSPLATRQCTSATMLSTDATTQSTTPGLLSTFAPT